VYGLVVISWEDQIVTAIAFAIQSFVWLSTCLDKSWI